jgi:hypothetical protein
MFGMATGVLIPLVVILIISMHAGQSPHRHTMLGDDSGQTPPSSVTEHSGQHP